MAMTDDISNTPPPSGKESVEGICQTCGGFNPVWSAENSFFNKVNGSPYGIICPTCFIKKANELDIDCFGLAAPSFERREGIREWLINKSNQKPVGEKYSFDEVAILISEFEPGNLIERDKDLSVVTEQLDAAIQDYNDAMKEIERLKAIETALRDFAQK